MGCSSQSDAPRAVVIGIDSADWKLIDALAAQGRMPNLRGLRERGVSGPIETLRRHPALARDLDQRRDRQDGREARHHLVHGRSARWHARAGAQPQPQGEGALEHPRRGASCARRCSAGGRPIPPRTSASGAIVSDALGFHGFGRTARDGDDQQQDLADRSLREARWADAYRAAARRPSSSQRFIHLDAQDYRDEKFDPARFPSATRNPDPPLPAVRGDGAGLHRDRRGAAAQQPYDLFLMYFEQVDSFSHLFMKYAPPKLAWIDAAGLRALPGRRHRVVPLPG